MTPRPEDDTSTPPPGSADTVVLDGVSLAAMTERGCIDRVLDDLDAGVGGWLVTVHLDMLRRVRRVDELRELIGAATLRVADGMPLVWASRLQRTPLPGRVAGSNLVDTLSGAAAERERSVFLLGGNPGTADAAAAELRRRYPTLRVAGTHCPPIGFEQDDEQLQRIGEAIDSAQPDIVYVALGFPKQERLIARLRDRRPAGWWIGVGISFSFLCGEVTRAPGWMQRLGMEWLHRLWQEPRRLIGRYLLCLPFGAGLLVRSALRGVGCRNRICVSRTLL
ncbi:MAG: WecB/TagA/CpsF family glycosyltransferase [Phycisphaera sp.]|nr:WecB/TagA/CpsF family glycosyltransferase [Phycisphaera sp.]